MIPKTKHAISIAIYPQKGAKQVKAKKLFQYKIRELKNAVVTESYFPINILLTLFAGR